MFSGAGAGPDVQPGRRVLGVLGEKMSQAGMRGEEPAFSPALSPLPLHSFLLKVIPTDFSETSFQLRRTKILACSPPSLSHPVPWPTLVTFSVLTPSVVPSPRYLLSLSFPHPCLCWAWSPSLPSSRESLSHLTD